MEIPLTRSIFPANKLDPVFGIPYFMDEIHHEVHEGKYFVTQMSSLTVAFAGVFQILITVGNKDFHSSIVISASALSYIDMYENASITNPGTNRPFTDTNRSTANTPPTNLLAEFGGVYVSGSPQLIFQKPIPAGGKKGGSGAVIRIGVERVLDAGKLYLLTVTSNGGGAVTSDIDVEIGGYASDV